MNQKRNAKSIAILLAAVLCVTSLAGCGRGGGKRGGLDVSLDHSFSAEQMTFPGVDTLDGVMKLGDNLLLVQESDEGVPMCYLYKSADASVKEVDIAYMEQTKDGKTSHVQSALPTKDGGLAFLVSSYQEITVGDDYDYKDLGSKLEIYDNEMNHIDTKLVSEGEDDAKNFGDLKPGPNGGYYTLRWDDAGNSQLVVLDADLKETGVVSGDIQYIDSLVSLPDESAFVSYVNLENNNVYGKIDPKTYQLTKVELQGAPRWSDKMIASTDPAYDAYLGDSNSLYGINVENGTCEEVINWVNSDFMGNRVNDVFQLNDGSFLITEEDDQTGDSSVWKLKPRDPAELKNIKLISMATMGLNDSLGRAVNEFNRSQSEYRIAIANYDKYITEEDYDAGLKQLQNDMTSGIVADLICVDGLPYESFCSKGLFADLSDKAAGLSPDEYYTNFFDSLRYGSKLYRMGFSFSVNTLMAKKDKVSKAGMSTSEFSDLLSGLPEDMKPVEDMTRSYAMYMFVNSNINSFVNVETGECRFNSPEFVKLLELCYECPEESGEAIGMDTDEYGAEQAYSYINDKVLLYPCWVNDIRSFYRDQYQQFDKNPVILCGYPTMKEGSNGSRFNPYFTLAVSANSPYKDKCWEFMSSMLTDSYQDSLNWTLPVKKSSFDKKAAE
ncbi:MAG: hypothetical protein IKN55_10430, partial [Oscillospiraceae bacterium]|nr:hypothetical protein [Oscillospiraceae bacterium]